MWNFVVKNALYIAFGIAWMATLGSLYFSEIKHWTPCLLCWYQRILMYPLVILFGVAIWRKEKVVAYYVLPMTILGSVIAFYQYLLQMTPVRDLALTKCDAFGSCAEVKAITFGSFYLPHFVTIPLLSLTAFIAISILMVILVKSQKKNVR